MLQQASECIWPQLHEPLWDSIIDRRRLVWKSSQCNNCGLPIRMTATKALDTHSSIGTDTFLLSVPSLIRQADMRYALSLDSTNSSYQLWVKLLTVLSVKPPSSIRWYALVLLCFYTRTNNLCHNSTDPYSARKINQYTLSSIFSWAKPHHVAFVDHECVLFRIDEIVCEFHYFFLEGSSCSFHWRF